MYNSAHKTKYGDLLDEIDNYNEYDQGRNYEREIFEKEDQKRKERILLSVVLITVFVLIALVYRFFYYERTSLVFGVNGTINLAVETHLGLKYDEYPLRYNKEESYWEIQSSNGEWSILFSSFGEPIY